MAGTGLPAHSSMLSTTNSWTAINHQATGSGTTNTYAPVTTNTIPAAPAAITAPQAINVPQAPSPQTETSIRLASFVASSPYRTPATPPVDTILSTPELAKGANLLVVAEIYSNPEICRRLNAGSVEPVVAISAIGQRIIRALKQQAQTDPAGGSFEQRKAALEGARIRSGAVTLASFVTGVAKRAAKVAADEGEVAITKKAWHAIAAEARKARFGERNWQANEGEVEEANGGEVEDAGGSDQATEVHGRPWEL